MSLSILLNLINKLGNKTLLFFSYQVQEPLNGKNNIYMNFNQLCINLIQLSTMNLQFIKIISRKTRFLL